VLDLNAGTSFSRRSFRSILLTFKPPGLCAAIYPANTTAWRPGDYVIHEYDSKCADMLMRVLSVARDGTLTTRYADEQMHRCCCLKTWINQLNALHDPTLFGIALPATPARKSSR
jgi:hypothetical protein